MSDHEIVCFCTEKTKEEVKQYIRDNHTAGAAFDGPQLMKIHASFADEKMVGRCCGCLDEVEDILCDYRDGKWQ